MKKFLLLSTMLLVSLVGSAQVKVAPKMQKGDKKTYVMESVMTLQGKEMKMTCESVLEVKEAKADGYVIDYTIVDVQSNNDASDFTGRILALSNEILKKSHQQYLTDKDGKVVKVLNYEEVKKGIGETCEKLVDELLAQSPDLGSMISKEMLMKQVMDGFTEETLLKTLHTVTSPFALNGKTIVTGAQDEYENVQGLKMKRMYFVNGDGSIVTSSTMNMSKDEMKKMIIEQVEKMAPDQAEMVKQNIDMVMNSGMMKIESTEKATYTFQADGWVSSIKAEVSCDAMGQKTVSNTIVRLK